ncbi:MAG: hypothetical protein A2Y78_06040 [Acidobacteria bacterium RBG_13_68_16]|jgi:hypothetical protein|nr:MAG: hypothetical protein A2Y78_06040 [Acidobacteria bacterium RBG_13_68_16]
MMTDVLIVGTILGTGLLIVGIVEFVKFLKWASRTNRVRNLLSAFAKENDYDERQRTYKQLDLIPTVMIGGSLLSFLADVSHHKRDEILPHLKRFLPAIRERMDVDDVIGILGEPDGKASAAEVARAIHGMPRGWSGDMEFWTFHKPWGDYKLMIDGAHVHRVHSQPAPDRQLAET